MYFRLVALAKTFDDRQGRQHLYDCVLRPVVTPRIPFRRPKQQRVAQYEVRPRFNLNEATIRQRTQFSSMGDLFPSLVDSRGMQFHIHVVRERKVVTFTGAPPPRVPEGVVSIPAALSARSMPGGECDGFIKEEQLGVPIFRHYDPVAILEFQNARDPTPAFIAAYDFPIAIMQCAAAIAQHCPASVRPKDIAEGIYTVLKWHPEVHIMSHTIVGSRSG